MDSGKCIHSESWCDSSTFGTLYGVLIRGVKVTQIVHKTHLCILMLLYQGRLRGYCTQEHLGQGLVLGTHQSEDDYALAWASKGWEGRKGTQLSVSWPSFFLITMNDVTVGFFGIPEKDLAFNVLASYFAIQENKSYVMKLILLF